MCDLGGFVWAEMAGRKVCARGFGSLEGVLQCLGVLKRNRSLEACGFVRRMVQ